MAAVWEISSKQAEDEMIAGMMEFVGSALTRRRSVQKLARIQTDALMSKNITTKDKLCISLEGP